MTLEQAELYHCHHQEYTEDIPLWLALAEKYGDPILELGCGTGRVLLRLAEAGHRVWGLDRDEKMLAVLRAQAEAPDLPENTLILGDMAHFQAPMAFSLIILPCNTYSTLTGEERTSTLEAVNLHLSPGGAFATSVPNPERLALLPEEGEAEVETTFTHPHSGNPVQVSSAWSREEDEVVVRWHYDHLFSDGQVLRTTTETRHFPTAMKEYLGEFLQRGWNVKTYGDFTFTPYDRDSTYLILVGTKASGRLADWEGEDNLQI
jgi:SAM-dependent methyltransferase